MIRYINRWNKDLFGHKINYSKAFKPKDTIKRCFRIKPDSRYIWGPESAAIYIGISLMVLFLYV